jgi:hypothetical protein
MGAWGAGIFENDDALDWFDALENAGADAVLVALQTIPEEAEYVESSQASEALAAAEIVAAAHGHPAASLPGEAADWLAANAASIDATLVRLAIDAVTRIRAESELKELWDEAAPDDRTQWYANVDDLLGRLKG